MTLRQTHTVAELDLSPAAYDEIVQKLSDAGYDIAALNVASAGGDPIIDLSGIGILRDAATATDQDDRPEPNKRQVGGEHYGGVAVQHWDIVAMHDLDYFQGQITKYVMRWKLKNGVQDLEKAQHFLEKYISLMKKPISPEQKLLHEQRTRHYT